MTALTNYLIELYEKMESLDRRGDKLREEMDSLLPRLTPDEMSEYVNSTQPGAHCDHCKK